MAAKSSGSSRADWDAFEPDDPLSDAGNFVDEVASFRGDDDDDSGEFRGGGRARVASDDDEPRATGDDDDLEGDDEDSPRRRRRRRRRPRRADGESGGTASADSDSREPDDIEPGSSDSEASDSASDESGSLARPAARPRATRSGTARPGSGARPAGSRPVGTRPAAARPGVTRPAGERTGGERTGTERSSGERAAGSRPPGSRPAGARPAGRRPPSARVPGERPISEPRPPVDRVPSEPIDDFDLDSDFGRLDIEPTPVSRVPADRSPQGERSPHGDRSSDGEPASEGRSNDRDLNEGRETDSRTSDDIDGDDRDRDDRQSSERGGGERSSADRVPGERYQGDRSHGERTYGERPLGERTGGERPIGERTGGERTGGGRPHGSRPGGDQRGGDRRGGDQRSSFSDNRGGGQRGRRGGQGSGQPSGQPGFRGRQGDQRGGNNQGQRRGPQRRDSNQGGYQGQNPRGPRGPNTHVIPGADIPPGEGIMTQGVLELHPKGYGFLRDPKNNYVATKTDPFVPGTLIEKCRLREGVLIKGEVVPGTRGQGPRLRMIETIEGRTRDEWMQCKSFDELTAINPFEQIKLETGPTPITMRVLDLLTPIGKGQRALIVAPPRSGKTMLLQEMANAVSVNHPELHLIVLLIDERPEEVTEMRRRVRGEVISSSMDRDVESHVRLAQLIIERAKRIAESGGEVFVLLDSITRTARAFNKWVGNTGRTMTGGLDVKALDIPKKLFGTARRFDEGGSLTVVGTALVDTGSAMDQVIFQEFKGTGNMELVLNRQLADRRIWPALDITQSGTRREEKILDPQVLEGVTMLRRSLVSLNPVEAMETLCKTLARFPSNKEFLTKVRSIL